MHLSSREYRRLLDILDVLYSQSDQSAIFKTAREKLNDFLDVSNAVFIGSDAETGKFLFGDHDIFGNSESAMLSCLAHYAARNPFFLTGRFLGYLNDSAGDTGPLPGNALFDEASAFEYLAGIGEFHLLGAALGKQGELAGIFAIHRREAAGDISEREKEIFNILLPHMARALRNLEKLQGEQGNDPVGFIAVGEDGSSYFMNEYAKSILGGMTVASLAGPGEGASSALFRSKNDVFRVRTVPADGNKKFIFLERCPANRKIQSALEKFGLGRRERDVASLAVQGFSNREISRELFLSEQTVKDYLYQVYGKLGVRRRSELAAIVFELD